MNTRDAGDENEGRRTEVKPYWDTMIRLGRQGFKGVVRD